MRKLAHQQEQETMYNPETFETMDITPDKKPAETSTITQQAIKPEWKQKRLATELAMLAKLKGHDLTVEGSQGWLTNQT